MSGEMWAIVAVVGVVVAVTLAATAVLLVRLVRARKMLTDAGIPVGNKLAFWGAIAYVVSPVDLMPDPILLDDIGVLLIALRALTNAATNAGAELPLTKPERTARTGRPSADKAHTADTTRTGDKARRLKDGTRR